MQVSKQVSIGGPWFRTTYHRSRDLIYRVMLMANRNERGDQAECKSLSRARSSEQEEVAGVAD